MLGLTTVSKAHRAISDAFIDGLIKGFQYGGLLFLIIFLFIDSGEAQFSWPTYPVASPTQIYKVMKDNGSGTAVLATGDSTHFLGITQNAVVTSTGKVQLATSGPSQVQVGSTPVTLGGAVTADASGNVVPYNPSQDGNTHCLLGYVIAGNVSAGGFVYVNVSTVCSVVPNASGGGVTSFFGNTGNITALIDPTNVIDATGNSIDFTTTGVNTTAAGANTAHVKVTNANVEIGAGSLALQVGTNFAQLLGGHILFQANGFEANGVTVQTSNGCSEGSLTGGTLAGSLKISHTGTCSSSLLFATVATNGYACSIQDITTPGPTSAVVQTSIGTSSAGYTASGVVSGDVFVFQCMAF